VEQHVYSRTIISVSYHYKEQTQRVGLVQIGYHHNFIECSLFCHDKSVKNAHLALHNNHSLTHSLTHSPTFAIAICASSYCNKQACTVLKTFLFQLLEELRVQNCVMDREHQNDMSPPEGRM
jgi:hypothetical protein